MRASTRALLAGILDYAGTFPPAGLTLADALENYRRERSGDAGWILGRLVLPAGSLGEFERLISTVLPNVDGQPWPLSVVLGSQPAGALEEVLAFNQRTTSMARVVSVDFPPIGASDIQDLMRRVPHVIEAFFELPPNGDVDVRVDAIASAGALAKVRTGGVTAGAFPSPENLVRLLGCCAASGVAFKATAGLHHAVRGCYPLTYEPDSPTGTMYGFLNLCLAAALLHTQADASEAVEALEESAATAFRFQAEGLSWRNRLISVESLVKTRRHFFRSFGSCSFREPVGELAALP